MGTKRGHAPATRGLDVLIHSFTSRLHSDCRDFHLLIVVVAGLQACFRESLGRCVVNLHTACSTRTDRARVDLLEVVFFLLHRVVSDSS